MFTLGIMFALTAIVGGFIFGDFLRRPHVLIIVEDVFKLNPKLRIGTFKRRG